MMKTQNKYLNNKRLKILKLAKLIIAEEGLNSNTFETNSNHEPTEKFSLMSLKPYKKCFIPFISSKVG